MTLKPFQKFMSPHIHNVSHGAWLEKYNLKRITNAQRDKNDWGGILQPPTVSAALRNDFTFEEQYIIFYLLTTEP